MWQHWGTCKMEGGCGSTGVDVRWRGYVAALGYM